jgi:hypothetical protein
MIEGLIELVLEPVAREKRHVLLNERVAQRQQ